MRYLSWLEQRRRESIGSREGKGDRLINVCCGIELMAGRGGNPRDVSFVTSISKNSYMNCYINLTESFIWVF